MSAKFGLQSATFLHIPAERVRFRPTWGRSPPNLALPWCRLRVGQILASAKPAALKPRRESTILAWGSCVDWRGRPHASRCVERGAIANPCAMNCCGVQRAAGMSSSRPASSEATTTPTRAASWLRDRPRHAAMARCIRPLRGLLRDPRCLTRGRLGAIGRHASQLGAEARAEVARSRLSIAVGRAWVCCRGVRCMSGVLPQLVRRCRPLGLAGLKAKGVRLQGDSGRGSPRGRGSGS